MKLLRPMPRRVALLLVLATSACTPLAPTTPPMASLAAPSLEVTTSLAAEHEIEFGTDAYELSSAQTLALEQFLRGNVHAGDHLVLIGSADPRASDLYNLSLSAKRLASSIATVKATDTSYSTLAIGEWPPSSAGLPYAPMRKVRLLVRRDQVMVQGCDPTIRTEITAGSPTLGAGTHGCATAANLAAMLDRPADLTSPRGARNAFGRPAADAVDRYFNDSIKAVANQSSSDSQ